MQLFDLLSGIKQKKQPGVKLHLTDDRFNYAIYYKIDAIALMMKAKGIDEKKRGSYVKLAKILGITRAYLSMLKDRLVPVSSEVIVRTAVILNNTAEGWHTYFEICVAEEKMSHQKYNMLKYSGELPYNKNSSAFEVRKNDEKIIEKNT